MNYNHIFTETLGISLPIVFILICYNLTKFFIRSQRRTNYEPPTKREQIFDTIAAIVLTGAACMAFTWVLKKNTDWEYWTALFIPTMITVYIGVLMAYDRERKLTKEEKVNYNAEMMKTRKSGYTEY